MNDVSQLLANMRYGDPAVAAQLLPLVYDELRRLAAHWLAQENPGHTLQATALVHEAYIRLTGNDRRDDWDHRGHFFAAVAEAMRCLLIDHARRRKRLKRGGDRQRLSLDAAESVVVAPTDDLLALDDALTRFSEIDPIKAKVVKMRFFAGLTMPEIAQALQLSLATIERYWTFARTWLYAELNDRE